MILRKPYAFLIKNFKRIHFIIAIMMGYLVYKSSIILEYLNRYINEGWLNNSNIQISDYMTLWTFGVIILTIIMLGIVLTLLINKKKPTVFYMVSIGMLIGTIGVYLLVLSNLNTILIEVIDPRTIRITRDLVMIMFVLQIINVIFSFVRATGFNIRKFDFEKDLKELDVTAKDYEEIELTLKIDANEIRRELRRRKRKFRYFILENLVAFIVFIIIFSISLGVYIFLNVTIYEKTYTEGEAFKTTEGIITIDDTYYTTVDYRGQEMGSDSFSYLVVKFKVSNITDDDVYLDVNNFILFIDEVGYSPVVNKYVSMSDFGEGYSNQSIESRNTEEFIVAFELSKDISLNNVVLKYIDYYKVVKVYELETNYKNIEISPVKIEEEKEIYNYDLGELINLYGAEAIIDNYDFNIRYDDGGLIRADTLAEYDKTLLKLEISSENKFEFANLIETYGTIKYIDGDKYITHIIPLINMTNVNSENIYIEVLSDVEDSEKIDLILETREGIYMYNLRNE